MKSLLVTILALFSFTCLYSQIYPDKYFVAFTDKNNSPYSIENPQEYLSARAIERRSRYNIPIDIHDLPVNPQYIEAVADIGVQVINPTKWLNGITIYTNDPSLLSEIEALPFVKSVRKARQATQAHPKLILMMTFLYLSLHGKMRLLLIFLIGQKLLERVLHFNMALVTTKLIRSMVFLSTTTVFKGKGWSLQC